jgi:hypothetical protein
MRAIAGRVTENDVALAACAIAASRADGTASFDEMRHKVPSIVPLSAADRRQSITRHNEELWEQLMRNIKSHDKEPGNFIHDGYLQHVRRVGYRITDAGRRYLDARRYR